MSILDMYDVFIFDLDGTLIYSEKYHYYAYKDAIEYHDLKIDLEWNTYIDYKHSSIKSLRDIFKKNHDLIYESKCAMYDNYIQKVKLFPYVNNLLELLLKNNKILCIVTDATRATFNKLLENIDILQVFNHVITRDDVNERKPCSEPYQKVRKLYEIRSKQFLCFEDSYKGIASAESVFDNIVIVDINKTLHGYNRKYPKISSYENILSTKYKPFYMSSKTNHKHRWGKFKRYNLISRWIDNDVSKNDMSCTTSSKLIEDILEDAHRCEYCIVYTEKNECMFGVLLEIGMFMILNKPIYILGHDIMYNEIFRNYKNFEYTFIDSSKPENAIANIILYNLCVP